jgi:hypothetical protein
MPSFVLAGVALGAAVILHYVYDTRAYHRTNRQPSKIQLAPRYPVMIPYLGTILLLLWDWSALLKRATCYADCLTSSRLSIGPHYDVHLFQDRDTIKEIWKKSAVMCAGKVHVFACRYMFGMKEKTLLRYAADDSGPFLKPYPGSKTASKDRIHRILNDGVETALTGAGFDPKLQRFRTDLMAQVNGLSPMDGEWIQIPNFHKFIHDTVGLSIIRAIFGPNLTQLNPTFMDDLFEFEHWFPLLAKGLPSFIIPKAYDIRRRLHSHFKRWYAYAREHFTEDSISSDGDGDPFWGSDWMRRRQKALALLEDEDSLAAGDLGVSWASLSNIVAASALLVFHVASDSELTSRMETEIASTFGKQSLADINLKTLSNKPVLASFYAETLRLYVQTFTLVSAPLRDVPLGKYWLPKNALGIVNSDMAHMDNEFWNTKNGEHPVSSFWADRFVVDPKDPTSGPSNLAYRSPKTKGTEPYFSTEGLEGSWIPYGGGHLVCPGRFLAKNVMIFTCALLTREFEIEVLSKELEFTSRNYGFGISMPKQAIAIRMRRKNVW